MRYPGSGVVLDCIDSWSLPSFLLWCQITSVAIDNYIPDNSNVSMFCKHFTEFTDFSVVVMLCHFLSFFLYILPGARFRALSAGVHCTLRVAGWKPTSNHIEITVGFFNLHRGWLSLHRGHPVNVSIRRTMHLSSVIPANDTRENVFRHRNFSRRERESNLGPLAPEASA